MIGSPKIACIIAAVVAELSYAGTAAAGRRTGAWSYDTETVPERQVELETWITQEIQGADGSTGSTVFLWQPVIGVTDRIELALPLTAEYSRETGTSSFTSWGISGTWRLTSADPAVASRVVPLIAVGVRRPVDADDALILTGHVAVSIDPIPKLHIVVNAGVNALTKPREVVVEGSGAVMYAITDDLKAGIDAFGDYDLVIPGASEGWFTIGPALALTHGRFWAAASVPFGVTAKAPDLLPRLVWGIAF